MRVLKGGVVRRARYLGLVERGRIANGFVLSSQTQPSCTGMVIPPKSTAAISIVDIIDIYRGGRMTHLLGSTSMRTTTVISSPSHPINRVIDGWHT